MASRNGNVTVTVDILFLCSLFSRGRLQSGCILSYVVELIASIIVRYRLHGVRPCSAQDRRCGANECGSTGKAISRGKALFG